MRLPVTPQISTKDGVSAKNARLTNCLKEVKKSGDLAVVRPGLSLEAEGTGVGGGLVAFNNELVSVYGATLGLGVTSNPIQEFYTPDEYPFGGRAASSGSLIMFAKAWIPEVLTSTDGVTFSVVNTTDELYGLFFAFLNFYAFDITFTKLYRSTDSGVNWTEIHDFSPYVTSIGLNAEVTPSGVNILTTYLGNRYRFSTTDFVSWSGPTAVASYPATTLNFPCVYFPVTGKTYYLDGAAPTHMYATSDNFSTLGTQGRIVYWGNSGNIPNMAVLGDSLYLVCEDADDQIIYLDVTTDGVTWNTFLTINTDVDPGSTESFTIFVLNGMILVYYFSDFTPTTVTKIPFGGVIPPIGTISIGNYDFAQSPT